MREILYRLFCKHNYKFVGQGLITRREADFGGEGYNTWEERYRDYVCTKCGKTKRVFDV